MSIRILLVDDHAVVLRGLHFFLATQKDFTIIGEAHNGKEALEMVATSKPDVILMDLVMPEMDGIEATAQIRKQHPDVKVLVLTSYNDQDYVLPALQAGASGYLLKDMKPDQIVESIRGALSGNIQLHPDVTQKLMTQMSAPVPLNSPAEGKASQVAASVWENITKREREVLVLIAQGMSNKEIASVLVIAEKTVKTHVSSILAKLNLADRTQAALFAVKHGMLE
ncbi:MAG TPA: response regulator transcription factor [Candidatus Bathyarchaeia archaeon]|nr:response regulator transcription factor [Candidatus Bathyarchaeia archaeon]